MEVLRGQAAVHVTSNRGLTIDNSLVLENDTRAMDPAVLSPSHLQPPLGECWPDTSALHGAPSVGSSRCIAESLSCRSRTNFEQAPERKNSFRKKGKAKVVPRLHAGELETTSRYMAALKPPVLPGLFVSSIVLNEEVAFPEAAKPRPVPVMTGIKKINASSPNRTRKLEVHFNNMQARNASENQVPVPITSAISSAGPTTLSLNVSETTRRKSTGSSQSSLSKPQADRTSKHTFVRKRLIKETDKRKIKTGVTPYVGSNNMRRISATRHYIGGEKDKPQKVSRASSSATLTTTISGNSLEIKYDDDKSDNIQKQDVSPESLPKVNDETNLCHGLLSREQSVEEKPQDSTRRRSSVKLFLTEHARKGMATLFRLTNKSISAKKETRRAPKLIHVQQVSNHRSPSMERNTPRSNKTARIEDKACEPPISKLSARKRFMFQRKGSAVDFEPVMVENVAKVNLPSQEQASQIPFKTSFPDTISNKEKPSSANSSEKQTEEVEAAVENGVAVCEEQMERKSSITAIGVENASPSHHLDGSGFDLQTLCDMSPDTAIGNEVNLVPEKIISPLSTNTWYNDNMTKECRPESLQDNSVSLFENVSGISDFSPEHSSSRAEYLSSCDMGISAATGKSSDCSSLISDLSDEDGLQSRLSVASENMRNAESLPIWTPNHKINQVDTTKSPTIEKFKFDAATRQIRACLSPSISEPNQRTTKAFLGRLGRLRELTQPTSRNLSPQVNRTCKSPVCLLKPSAPATRSKTMTKSKSKENLSPSNPITDKVKVANEGTPPERLATIPLNCLMNAKLFNTVVTDHLDFFIPVDHYEKFARDNS